MAVEKKTRVVVAMSGGVDSAVAALLLVRQGYEVIGLSMRLYSYEKEATHGCCTPEDLYDARRVADVLGIPHYVSDFEIVFEEKVIQNFINSYKVGETPNPCARCNQDVKFSALLKRAQELGAEFLATGHYARKEVRNGKEVLLRSIDQSRDQTYFLFGLTDAELKKLMFPLGNLEKTEVRRLAKEAGLNVADKPDSQEICFVPKDYASFVEKKLKPSEIQTGKIVTEKGEVLGDHGGIHNFTIGQRRGIGFPTPLPSYVVSIEQNGNVVVGSDASLFKNTFQVRELKWFDEPPAEGETILAQIRSRFKAEPALIEQIEGDASGKIQVKFLEPQRAITPGQAAVFYRNDQLIGGGWIERVC